MNALIVKLLTRPAQAWRNIRDEEEHSPRQYVPHLILLGLIPAICLYIGTTQVGWSMTFEDRVWLSTKSALQLCTLLYVAILVGTTLMGTFIRWLSRTSEARPTLNQCIGFATYTITPFFIAGLAGLYPSRWLMILVLGLASIHSTFLLVIGIGTFMRLPPGNAPLYAAAVWGFGVLVLVTILVSTILLWYHVLTPDYVRNVLGEVPGG
ncbi:YIP1 family protein [Pseudomonas alliivorans]|uniref:Yip1 family protein n=1 Tax=Pseudomonas alliivorans TaxID=2810613 RepID=UPI00211C0DFD|nr:Yip1 family protein [Pseudomonas alliivorans]MCQ9470915.1 YIP1 family protein [Pseudomonas alliivorans]